MSKKNYSVARVVTHTQGTIGKCERHNERKNESYANMNVDTARSDMNVHFKICGEQNIISAVMHADELNVALTERYGKPVYHYHMHLVALPVVKKQILWTKRCKDKSLVGTVKETVNQISHSKKWKSPQAVDENGNVVFNEKGKPVLIPSYSILQDDFFNHMQRAGFNDFLRGEKGSMAEH